MHNLFVELVQEKPRVKKKKVEPFTFSDDDLPTLANLHNDALVVTMEIMGTNVELEQRQRVVLDVFRKLKLSLDSL